MAQRKNTRQEKGRPAAPPAGRPSGGIRKDSRKPDHGSQSGELQPQATEEQFELERLGVEGVAGEPESRPQDIRENDPIIRRRREGAENVQGGTQEKVENARRRKAS